MICARHKDILSKLKGAAKTLKLSWNLLWGFKFVFIRICEFCLKFDDILFYVMSWNGTFHQFSPKTLIFLLSVLIETSIIKQNSFQVDCHLNGNSHDLALKQQGLEAYVTAAPGNKRPCSSTTIDEAINNISEEVYKRMMRTTWNMANKPSMPHSHFSVLVKCQSEKWSLSSRRKR